MHLVKEILLFHPYIYPIRRKKFIDPATWLCCHSNLRDTHKLFLTFFGWDHSLRFHFCSIHFHSQTRCKAVFLVTCGSDRDYVDARLINGGGTWHVCPYRLLSMNRQSLRAEVHEALFASSWKQQSYKFYLSNLDCPVVVLLLIVKLYRFRKLLSQPRDAANLINAVFEPFV